MSLSWYFHRLAAMSPAEFLYRLNHAARTFLERKEGFPRGKIYRSGESQTTAWLAFCHDAGVGFFWEPSRHSYIVSEFLRSYPDGCRATFQTADALLGHRIEIFGKSFELGDDIDWQRDPLTGRSWPLRFWADMDYRTAEAVGGVKWTWEINRHHHLVTLTKAYFLSGDERYAQEALAQISSWIDENPPGMGIHWTSSLELAIRVINWGWVLRFLRGSSSLQEELFAKIQGSIADQAVYISSHLSAYSSANNHRVGEAAGLAFVGILFPWLAEAQRWKQTGIAILTTEIEKLILPDGGPAEQAVHYLMFILDFYFIVKRLAQVNQISLKPIWQERIQAAAHFLCSIMDDQGCVPAIGDNDDAWVVRLDDRPGANNYQSILATAAAWFQDPRLKSPELDWDEKSWWLLGEEGKYSFENLPPRNAEAVSQALTAGGYCILTAATSKVVVDCGPLGYGPIAAHGHADALSIWATLDGEELLVDSGTYAYQEGGKWRNYFRSTSAHNTLCIDGANQSEMLGAFLWGRKASCKFINLKTTDKYDLVVAQHDGYQNAGLIHRRAVLLLKPNILAVYDQVLGSGDHKIDQNWHFHSDCQLKISGWSCTVNIRNHPFVFEVLASPFDNLSIIEGQRDPIQGWVSPGYGQNRPGTVLNLSGKCSMPVRIVTAFFPSGLTQDLLEISKTEIKKIFEGMNKP